MKPNMDEHTIKVTTGQLYDLHNAMCAMVTSKASFMSTKDYTGTHTTPLAEQRLLDNYRGLQLMLMNIIEQHSKQKRKE